MARKRRPVFTGHYYYCDVDRTFAALAIPVRRGFLDLLKVRPRSAGEIQREWLVDAPLVSRHFRVLRQCGFVEECGGDTDARVRIYRLRQEPFIELRDWLDGFERVWR